MTLQDKNMKHELLTILGEAGKEYEYRASRLQMYGPHIKVVCKPAAPPSCDIVVRVWNYGKWVDVAKFNDMSDDFALTNAHKRALEERQKILEQEW